jgi:cellulose biosynthesis protein BcsQ
VITRPYVLVLGSHKGGTGRTTSALALAYLWGQAGLSVALIDADPVGAAGVVAVGPDGSCRWKGVRFFARLPESLSGLADCDRVIIDAPPLTERPAQRVLRLADGVIVSCLADPLSLWTVPSAARAIKQARQHNPRLSLLGLHIAVFREHDLVQSQMLQELRQTQSDFLLEPPIPAQPEISDWALKPGSEMPACLARDSYEALAQLLDSTITLGRCEPRSGSKIPEFQRKMPQRSARQRGEAHSQLRGRVATV